LSSKIPGPLKGEFATKRGKGPERQDKLRLLHMQVNTFTIDDFKAL
jgi:hypothetical protein